jgi:hypothetical protein
MTEPDQSPDLGEPTDVAADPDDLQSTTPDGDNPTSSAARYEEGDTKGGTGGLDAGGAG